MTDTIYQRPHDYDLEHEGDDRDVVFYRQLLERLQPRRVLDLACGSGRLTLPLAASSAGPESVVGIELSDDMLAQARRKLGEVDDRVAGRVTFERGDMRSWTSTTSFDLVLIGCSSISHLLSLDDRLAVWRHAYAALTPGGRFVVDITMPDIRTFATSLETPPRALVEIDLDRQDPDTRERLVRSKTTAYDAYEQRASVRFLYDKFQRDQPIERYVSDFESYVYSPGELRLLFVHTGFEIEGVWRDFTFEPPRSRARELVMLGRRGR